MSDEAIKTCPFCGAKFASPGPSELVEEMEKLVGELRTQIQTGGDPMHVQRVCADRLSALITRHRGKS